MDRDLIKQQLEYALEGTNFDDQGELYKGKVRDNYINEDTITMVTTLKSYSFTLGINILSKIISCLYLSTSYIKI